MTRIIHGAVLALLLLLWPTAAAQAAPTWANETELVNEASAAVRDTYVADPGRGSLWDRSNLISQYGSYYRTRGLGNTLTWAPRTSYDPGAATKWAGCGQLAGQHIGSCPDGQPLHMREIGAALVDTTITALVWQGSFIALGCGNFSEQATGPTPRIAGSKFEDVDGDGTRDPDEPGLDGWTVELYQNGSLLTSTQTNHNGDYGFDLDANTLAISSQDFELREVQKSGWVASHTPAVVRVPFGSGDRVFGGNNFGNYRPATIAGVKYEDMGADGARDADDPGLADWTINLGTGPSAPQSSQTLASGTYAFTGLRPGTYSVAEQLKPGWRYSSPADGAHTVTVRSGETKTAEFGNYRPATITGVKFDDHDVDRNQGASDGGLADWTIALSGGRSSDATTTTAADGRYSFTGLIPGSYTVAETLRAHWRQSAPASGTHTVSVRSGDTRDADFGNVCLSTAQVTMTDESTGTPLTGVEVRIEEIAVPGVLSNDPALPRTSTATPTFSGLLPGTYRIVAFLPAGKYTTDPDVTVIDGRLAVVKTITAHECDTAIVPIKLIITSTGKVTGGMKMQVPGGFATAGFVFMARKGSAEGSLEYQDHATGMNVHTNQIEQIYVRGSDAWIGGVIEISGAPRRFLLHLVDNGEPGTEDRFEILIDTSYRAGEHQTIVGGNVQIHT